MWEVAYVMACDLYFPPQKGTWKLFSRTPHFTPWDLFPSLVLLSDFDWSVEWPKLLQDCRCLSAIFHVINSTPPPHRQLSYTNHLTYYLGFVTSLLQGNYLGFHVSFHNISHTKLAKSQILNIMINSRTCLRKHTSIICECLWACGMLSWLVAWVGRPAWCHLNT